MNDKSERLMSAILTLCVVVMAVILVKREFFDSRAQQAMDGPSTPQKVANWNELRAGGVILRSPNAPVVIAEFADLECPACKQFNTRLQSVIADLHSDVGVVLVHYPLSIHRFSRQAARALECADRSGVANKFVDVAYAKQDSFGLKPWTQYALEAGVPDTVAFGMCARDTARVARIELGRRLGQELKLQGTPLIVINGWRFPNVPTDEQLREAIQALSRGRPPAGARAD
jgi:protein-disulfide isomerase